MDSFALYLDQVEKISETVLEAINEYGDGPVSMELAMGALSVCQILVWVRGRVSPLSLIQPDLRSTNQIIGAMVKCFLFSIGPGNIFLLWKVSTMLFDLNAFIGFSLRVVS